MNKNHGGAGRGQGRKPLSDQEKTVLVSIRMTDKQKSKLKSLGGSAWIRKQIDESQIPLVTHNDH